MPQFQLEILLNSSRGDRGIEGQWTYLEKNNKIVAMLEYGVLVAQVSTLALSPLRAEWIPLICNYYYKLLLAYFEGVMIFLEFFLSLLLCFCGWFFFIREALLFCPSPPCLNKLYVSVACSNSWLCIPRCIPWFP